MIKGKEIYPKTKRISNNGLKVQITEKLDGSNLTIFKLNDDIHIAQRKNIFNLGELEEVKQILYKGLYEWLKINGEYLKEHLIEGSCICGEWLGMGQIKYTIDRFDKRLYMFAKANIDDKLELYNIIYEHALFIYPFDNQEVPSFIGRVPVVANLAFAPNKENLDKLYEKYCFTENRPIEGFVINVNNSITKYVRMKSGKIVEYSDSDHKGINNE